MTLRVEGARADIADAAQRLVDEFRRGASDLFSIEISSHRGILVARMSALYGGGDVDEADLPPVPVVESTDPETTPAQRPARWRK